MNTKVETVYRELRQRLARLTGSDGEATAMARPRERAFWL